LKNVKMLIVFFDNARCIATCQILPISKKN